VSEAEVWICKTKSLVDPMSIVNSMANASASFISYSIFFQPAKDGRLSLAGAIANFYFQISMRSAQIDTNVCATRLLLCRLESGK
jgi:hypothetical protein